jgi:hypothetical protein
MQVEEKKMPAEQTIPAVSPGNTVTENTAHSPDGESRKRRGRPTREEAEKKKRRSGQTDFLIGCDLDERSDAVRLIRLIRTNYWLSNFARQILRMEADSPTQVTIDKVQKQLDRLAVIEDLIGRVQHIGRNPDNYFQDHPAVRAVLEEWGDEIFQYKSDCGINNTIDAAKKQHQVVVVKK